MRMLVKGLVLPLLVLAAWELATQLGQNRMESISHPSAILKAFIEVAMDGTLLVALPQTFAGAFGGLAVGAGAGIAVGVVFGLLPTLSKLMRVTTEALRPIPSIAVIPLALLVYGFGYKMESSIVAISCFWPLFIMTENAVRNIDPRLREVARALGFGLLPSARKIVLPAVLPQIFVALRLAAAVSLVVAVTVEITANPMGIGYSLIIAQQSLRPDRVFALIFWIGLIGWLFNFLLSTAQNKAFGRMGQWTEQRQ